jgi:hypothetical protein
MLNEGGFLTRIIHSLSSYRAVNTLRLRYENHAVKYKEILALCSVIRTECTNTRILRGEIQSS